MIAVACHIAGGQAQLTVDVAGPGLPLADRDRAFARFWRAAGEHGPGSGLGLAIVRRLVEADGGEAHLEDSPQGGLRAVVRLPLDG